MGNTAAQSGETVGLVRRVIIGRNPKLTLVRVACWALGLYLLSQYVLIPVRVVGPSMTPTYRDGGVNLINRLAFKFRSPRRGDVVGIKMSTTPGARVMLMKRIIGLPGDTVAFQRGRAVVNDQVLEEPYVKLPCNWEREPVKLEPDEYYVVGDNRSMPMQLHEQGKVWRTQFVGKAVL